MMNFKTRKAMIKEAERLNAKDITNVNSEFCYNLKIRASSLTFGVYGMNGGLFEDVEGNYYYITARNSNLFILA